MKIDYNKLMEEEIAKLEELNQKPKLLLHTCCAPCSSAVIERLTRVFNITVLYYNPNIEPLEEYLKRKEEQQKFIREFKPKNVLDFIDCDYDNEKFHEIAKGLETAIEGGSRCFKCYRLRLEYVAKQAKEFGYDYFGTTLSVSPYKNSQKLNEIGLELQKEYNVKYLVSDFKKKNGYKRSIELSKEYNLYRQNYCGCIYSKPKEKTVKQS